MKKVALFLLCFMPLLSGCWDQMSLRNLNLVDIAGVDVNDETGDIEIHYVITHLTKAGQGSGEPMSMDKKLKGKSVVDAVGHAQFSNQAPFIGISTGVYVFSEQFASHNPISELEFLIHAPYTSISTPVVIFEGNLSSFLEKEPEKDKQFTKEFFNFVKLLDQNSIISTTSMMQFIEATNTDLALPVIKQGETGVELNGALLFRQGKNTSVKLTNEEVQMMALLRGRDKGRQRYTGYLSGKEEKTTNQPNQNEYGFSVKKGKANIVVSSGSKKNPTITVHVQLKINAFKLTKKFSDLKSDVVNQMEKELSRQLEKQAAGTIKTMQEANCDVLGIGNKLKAYHPKVWEKLNWDKDYQTISIQPDFDVHILNADSE